MARKIKDPQDFWLRLDNAAKIYPAVMGRELPSVFRLSAELKDRVKARQLLEAVSAIESRFPYYMVKLKAGFFWYYLEPSDQPIRVMADQGLPCRAFDKGGLMFRILARDHTISVEFSHVLTDGSGALQFLKTLLLVYFQKCGVAVPPEVSFHRPGDVPSPDEFEDAFSRYFRKMDSRPAPIPKALHLPFELRATPRFDVLTAEAPIEPVIRKANEHQASLTEYLVAVYLYSLQSIYDEQILKKRKDGNVLRVEVPVNLRRMFPSDTMRNFSLYVIPCIDMRLGHYSFDEVVKAVHHQMQLETDKKLIGRMISRHVGGERNWFIRGLPLFVKSFVLSRLYVHGINRYSGVVTNIGRIDLGGEVNSLIHSFTLIPPPPDRALKVNCGLAGFDNNLVLSFGNVTVSRELERQFLKFLTAHGIPVRIRKHFSKQ